MKNACHKTVQSERPARWSEILACNQKTCSQCIERKCRPDKPFRQSKACQQPLRRIRVHRFLCSPGNKQNRQKATPGDPFKSSAHGAGTMVRLRAFKHGRLPIGSGPSSKVWPRWLRQRGQWTSVRLWRAKSQNRMARREGNGPTGPRLSLSGMLWVACVHLFWGKTPERIVVGGMLTRSGVPARLTSEQARHRPRGSHRLTDRHRRWSRGWHCRFHRRCRHCCP